MVSRGSRASRSGGHRSSSSRPGGRGGPSGKGAGRGGQSGNGGARNRRPPSSGGIDRDPSPATGKTDGEGRRGVRARGDDREGRRGVRARGDDREGTRGVRARGDDREGTRGPRPRTDRDEAALAGPRNWGRVARRGAGGINEPDPDAESRRAKARRPEERHAVDQTDQAEAGSRRIPASPERALPSADDLRRVAAAAVTRSRGASRRERRPLGARAQRVEDPAALLKRMIGPPRDKRLLKCLADAGHAFEAERFKDAKGLLTPLVKEVPELAEGRELLGLSLYRLGRWKDAIEELEMFRELTSSTEQHPVLADCHRALEQWADVDELWAELGDASPDPELVTEGRIVVAGAKADQDDLGGAIRILEQGWKLPKRPRPDHLRRAYALADLYERAGKFPRARELFRWVAEHDPKLADVRSRVRALK